MHTRVEDRTFNIAAGFGARLSDKVNVGFALHYVLRLYETSEDALNVSGAAANPTVGVYHATASFENGNLVGLLGIKWHYSEEWVFGASIGLPGVPLHSGGSVTVQDVVSEPGSPAQANVRTADVNSRTFVPALLRLGAAWIVAHHWTVSGQITGHLGTSYNRFSVDPAVEQRLRVQDHIERDPVIDLNARRRISSEPGVLVRAGPVHFAQRRAAVSAQPRRNAGSRLFAPAARLALRRDRHAGAHRPAFDFAHRHVGRLRHRRRRDPEQSTPASSTPPGTSRRK